MARVFIEIMTPGNGKTYEFDVDNGMNVNYLREMVIEEINEIESDNLYLTGENCMLYSLDRQKRLDNDAYLAEVGIVGGSRLLLL